MLKSVYQVNGKSRILVIDAHFVGAAHDNGRFCRLGDSGNNAAEQHHSDAGNKEVHSHFDHRCL